MDWYYWVALYLTGGSVSLALSYLGLYKRDDNEDKQHSVGMDMFDFWAWPLLVVVAVVFIPFFLGNGFAKIRQIQASKKPNYQLISELEVKNEISPPAKEEPVCVACNHRHRTQETHGECYACDCKEVKVYLDDSLVIIEEFKTNEPIFPAFGE